MQKKIAVIAGDGVGPEVTQQSIKALNVIAEQYGHQFRYSYCPMGSKAVGKTGDPLPAETIDICLDSDAILVGGVGNSRYDRHHPLGSEQALRKLYRALGLFAEVRPVHSYPALYHLSPLQSKYIEGTDLTVIRTLKSAATIRPEGAPAPDNESARNFEENDGKLAHLERIAALAFAYARTGKKKLTVVVSRQETAGSGAGKRVVEALAGRYGDVEVGYLFVDQAAAQLVLRPAQFGVIVAENEPGKILSGEAAALCGSVNLLPSAAIGQDLALFRPLHDPYPQWAGKDIANPLGAVLSAAMMLDYFQLRSEADLLRQAVNWTLAYNFVTRDIDAVNSYSTSIVGDLICEFIENRNPSNINPNNISLSHSTII